MSKPHAPTRPRAIHVHCPIKIRLAKSSMRVTKLEESSMVTRYAPEHRAFGGPADPRRAQTLPALSEPDAREPIAEKAKTVAAKALGAGPSIHDTRAHPTSGVRAREQDLLVSLERAVADRRQEGARAQRAGIGATSVSPIVRRRCTRERCCELRGVVRRAAPASQNQGANGVDPTCRAVRLNCAVRASPSC